MLCTLIGSGALAPPKTSIKLCYQSQRVRLKSRFQKYSFVHKLNYYTLKSLGKINRFHINIYIVALDKVECFEQCDAFFGA